MLNAMIAPFFDAALPAGPSNKSQPLPSLPPVRFTIFRPVTGSSDPSAAEEGSVAAEGVIAVAIGRDAVVLAPRLADAAAKVATAASCNSSSTSSADPLGLAAAASEAEHAIAAAHTAAEMLVAKSGAESAILPVSSAGVSTLLAVGLLAYGQRQIAGLAGDTLAGADLSSALLPDEVSRHSTIVDAILDFLRTGPCVDTPTPGPHSSTVGSQPLHTREAAVLERMFSSLRRSWLQQLSAASFRVLALANKTAGEQILGAQALSATHPESSSLTVHAGHAAQASQSTLPVPTPLSSAVSALSSLGTVTVNPGDPSWACETHAALLLPARANLQSISVTNLLVCARFVDLLAAVHLSYSSASQSAVSAAAIPSQGLSAALDQHRGRCTAKVVQLMASRAQRHSRAWVRNNLLPACRAAGSAPPTPRISPASSSSLPPLPNALEGLAHETLRAAYLTRALLPQREASALLDGVAATVLVALKQALAEVVLEPPARPAGPTASATTKKAVQVRRLQQSQFLVMHGASDVTALLRFLASRQGASNTVFTAAKLAEALTTLGNPAAFAESMGIPL
jgi:hypothetical protein